MPSRDFLIPLFHPRLHFLAVLTALGMLACTPSQHRRNADRETFGLIHSKGDEIVNMETGFHIDPAPALDLTRLAKHPQPADFLGDSADRELNATILTLDDALALGVSHSRTYLSRKEALYLTALELTLARHTLTPLFTAIGSGSFRSIPAEATSADANPTRAAAAEVASEIASGVDRVVRENTFTRTGNFGFTSLQRAGTRLAADFTTDFLQFLTGNTRKVNSSALAASIAQPLLRGAGYEATVETLTSAENDLLYDLREFARFRKSFVVDTAQRYYEVLRSRDAARNAWLADEAFQAGVLRAKALHQADRLTPTELGLLQQAALQSELDWINAIAEYESGLDLLKIELGIPVEEKIVLDPEELEKLKIIDPSFSREEALEIALATRLDFHTAHNVVADTERRIRVAANALRPGLDVVGSINIGSAPTSTTPRLEFEKPTWTAGIDLDLPLDNKAERNAYRTSLIANQRALRDLELAEDTIRLEIIEGFRSLERARRQYEISLLGVQLSENRLAAERAFLEAGRSTARDLIEAQLDYVDSLNRLTSAKVGHTISRLTFWRDLGILFIKPNGQWVKKLQSTP